MKNENSIANLRPDWAVQFDVEFNYPLTPEDVSVYSERKIGWVCVKGHTWINDPRHRMRAKHSDCPFCSGRFVTPGVNDLFTLCTHLKTEWSFEKNGELDPQTLHRSSNIKVWWKCDSNHEWEAKISNRTKENNPTGCPYCTGHRAIPGINDLASQRPDLAAQFDRDANHPLTAEAVSLMSKEKIGWICSQGHRWINDPQHRAREKSAECPYCSGHKVMQGETDLITLFPDLEKQWAYDLNGELDPHLLHRSSNRRVWWRCKEGHEWKTAINHRTDPNNPTGCPYCAGQRLIPGVNDLASQRPDIASQWYYAGNAPLLPTQVTVGAGKRVQWCCEEGHVWTTSINHRTCQVQPTNCPYCDGRRAIPGRTDLVTLHPGLMSEWDWGANASLDPTQLRPQSNKTAHWVCRMGHCWTATIKSRTRENGTNCPYCSGRHAIPGETDLKTRFPLVADEFDLESNGSLTPDTISAASNTMVAWVCKRGHRWTASVASRTCGKNNCPVCNGRKPEIGWNDLPTVRPDLIVDWAYDLNGDRQPQEFTVYSGYVAAWRCHVCGTNWKKSIIARTEGNKCPLCYRGRGRRASI